MSKKYDYIILGSGIAGLYSALMAIRHGSVLLITKGRIDDCNTRLAQGGIAAAIGKGDSPELHFKDTIRAGVGLCDENAVRILANEASDRIKDLLSYGVPFDTVDGEITLTLEAAHSLPRILHAGGDATGKHIELTLAECLAKVNVEVRQYAMATEVIVENGEAKGVKVLDEEDGSYETYDCRFLIIATGGAGQLYRVTTNPSVATGDGIALAFRAGAEIMDLEFFQFHPTALYLSGVPPFLISEAVRGEGGILRNESGLRFMNEYAEQGELAPRDVVSRSILKEMRKTGAKRVFLDVTHLPPCLVVTRFPQIYKYCLDNGIDITKNLIPVAPAAHYTIGGIRVNSWGETSVKGLLAVGEAACTGVHGANRLASNSLLEVAVFAKRLMKKTISPSECKEDGKSTQKIIKKQMEKREVDSSIKAPSLNKLQDLLWFNVGIERNGEDLKDTINALAAWQSKMVDMNDRASYELSNLVLLARIATESALIREESRGAHFRTDFPHAEGKWLKHIIITGGNKD